MSYCLLLIPGKNNTLALDVGGPMPSSQALRVGLIRSRRHEPLERRISALLPGVLDATARRTQIILEPNTHAPVADQARYFTTS